MAEVSKATLTVEPNKSASAATLLPLVYEELRLLAAHRLSAEIPGQTLQATALVHEAYLRLLGGESPAHWNGRGHFFAAAAEAMRRILVDAARRRKSLRRGGDFSRQDVIDSLIVAPQVSAEIEDLDEALVQFEHVDAKACELVKLRCFAGLTLEEAAEIAGIPRRTANRKWSFARAWLHDRIAEG